MTRPRAHESDAPRSLYTGSPCQLKSNLEVKLTNESASVSKCGVILAICLALAAVSHVQAEPKYVANVPESVMTPDKVETDSLGTMEFFDGMPSPDTVQKVYDNLDLTRGVTTFLDAIPITSMYAMLRGLREAGVKVGEVAISETLLDARSLLLTPNTTRIYILAQIDLSDGPVVMDAPPGMLGLIDDAAFQYVIDVGPFGPDKGKGGKFLFIPPGHEGDIPDGYFVAKSKTFDHWVALRASVKDDDTATPVKMVKESLNIYPLSRADNPPPEIFHEKEQIVKLKQT